MKRGDKIGIVACSNGLKESSRPEMEQLKITLESLGLTPVFSEYLYAQNGAESGTRQQRAEALMKFYRDEEIKGIFDVSGGNLANGVLPWLDYEVIAKSGKAFWGYSDLTTVVNAITAKTGKPSVLYQIRNLIYQDGEEQKCRFRDCRWNKIRKTGVRKSNACRKVWRQRKEVTYRKYHGKTAFLMFHISFCRGMKCQESWLEETSVASLSWPERNTSRIFPETSFFLRLTAGMSPNF